LPTVGETGRAFRDRPLGRALIFAAVVVAALLVARSCGETETKVSHDEAVAIGREAIDFEANYVQVRLIKRGFKSQEVWLVGLAEKEQDGTYVQAVSVLVDANSGEIIEIQNP
jgi:hypothetical protein